MRYKITLQRYYKRPQPQNSLNKRCRPHYVIWYISLGRENLQKPQGTLISYRAQSHLQPPTARVGFRQKKMLKSSVSDVVYAG